MHKIFFKIVLGLSLCESAFSGQVRFALKGILKSEYDHIISRKMYVEHFPWSGEMGGCHGSPQLALHEGDKVYWKGLHFGGWGEGERVWVVAPCDTDVETASIPDWDRTVSALESYYNGNDLYREENQKRRVPQPSDKEQFDILRTYTNAWRMGFMREQSKLYWKKRDEMEGSVKKLALSQIPPKKAELAAKNRDLATLKDLIKDYETKRDELNEKARLVLRDYKIYQDSLGLARSKINGVVQNINAIKPALSFDAVDKVIKEKVQLLELVHTEREASADLAHRSSILSNELQVLDSYYRVKFDSYAELFAQFYLDREQLNNTDMIGTLRKIDQYGTKRCRRIQSKVDALFVKIDQKAKKLINEIALAQSKEASANAMFLISSTEFSRAVRSKTEALNQTPKRALIKSGGVEIPLLYVGEHHERMKDILMLDLGCENQLEFMGRGCNNLVIAKEQATTFENRIPTIIKTGLLMISIYGSGIDKKLTDEAKNLLQKNDVEGAIGIYDDIIAQIDGNSES